MELSIEHLAPYLPYGLKCLRSSSPAFLDDTLFETIDFKPSHLESKYFNKENYKPILRPLSDLAKGINDGEETYKQWIVNNYGVFEELELIESIKFGTENYQVMGYLFEWHFDVFGLIDKGLAIDINTLK